MLGRATGELEPQGTGSLSIQIVTSSSLAGELPRVSFAAADQLEIAARTTRKTLGVNQRAIWCTIHQSSASMLILRPIRDSLPVSRGVSLFTSASFMTAVSLILLIAPQ